MYIYKKNLYVHLKILKWQTCFSFPIQIVKVSKNRVL